MRYQEESIAITPFNAAGDGYDMDTATAVNDYNEAEDRPSIDPRSGMILMGRRHPDWDALVEQETAAGNTIAKGDTGRYYSIKLPRFMSDPLAHPGEIPNILDARTRAEKDFEYAMENNVTLDWLDSAKREFGTASGLQKKIPFAGGMIGFIENMELIDTARRLQNPSRYEGAYYYEREQATLFGGEFPDIETWIARVKKADGKLISDYLKYAAADKSYMNKLISGASQLPVWFLEFAATGGLAKIGDEAAKKVGEKLIGAYAETAAGKVALWSARITAGGIMRGSFGLGHMTLETMSQRQLDVVLGMRKEEGWATSALMAWGDTVIEALSEDAGEGLTKGGAALLNKLPFGSKLTGALEKAWMTVTGGTRGEFARKLLSKGGYSNFLGEIGEERLGTLLRAITGADDFGLGTEAGMIDRLKAGILQDWENIGVELGVLAIPTAGQFVLAQVSKLGQGKEEFATIKAPEEIEFAQIPAVEQTQEGAAQNITPPPPKSAAPSTPAAEQGLVVYHGTESDIKAGDVEPDKALKGIYTTTSKEAAQTYGKNVFAYNIRPDAKVLDLSDGEVLWAFMQEQGILEAEDIENPDLENYVKGGQIFQYDTSNKTRFADDVVSTAKAQGYDVVRIPDVLPGSEDNIANVVINKDVMTPAAQAAPAAEQARKAEAANEPAAEKKTRPPKPITIDTAETTDEINEVTQQIIAQGAETSARQADLQADRAALGLDGVASAQRKSWQISLQQAKDQNLINSAMRTAAQINDNPRPLNDVETAGMVMKAAQLKYEHRAAMEKLDKAEDQAEIDSISAQIKGIEGEFDVLSQAIYKSGTEKGRALAAQKLTINQDFDLLSIKARAKKAKGRALTAKESAKIEQMAKDLQLQQQQIELLEQKIAELMAKKHIREGTVQRYARMTQIERDSELNSLIDRTARLLEEGCN